MSSPQDFEWLDRGKPPGDPMTPGVVPPDRLSAFGWAAVSQPTFRDADLSEDDKAAVQRLDRAVLRAHAAEIKANLSGLQKFFVGLFGFLAKVLPLLLAILPLFAANRQSVRMGLHRSTVLPLPSDLPAEVAVELTRMRAGEPDDQ